MKIATGLPCIKTMFRHLALRHNLSVVLLKYEIVFYVRHFFKKHYITRFTNVNLFLRLNKFSTFLNNYFNNNLNKFLYNFKIAGKLRD